MPLPFIGDEYFILYECSGCKLYKDKEEMAVCTEIDKDDWAIVCKDCFWADEIDDMENWSNKPQ